MLWVGSSNFLDDWFSTQNLARLAQYGRDKDVKWKPHEDGYWKINVDATTHYNDHSVGLGIIIRDGLGGVSAAKSIYVKAMYSPIIAKAMAVWQGLLLAFDHGFIPCLIDSESLQVVEMINKGFPPLLDVGPVISMICVLLCVNPGCGISHISRNANLVAHSLAKVALSLDSVLLLVGLPNQLNIGDTR
ncbi:hypothetical protein QYF36_010702 [Acer negundo]|nr:hypothetical protein QYF36_010702 [Acer negundo]